MNSELATWAGLRVGSRYEVREKLGEGGMGDVYHAWDTSLQTDVVIKVPKRAMLDDPEFAERFAREIRSLVKLSHPHIVKVLDVGRYAGLPFAVMQYLPNGDLRVRQSQTPGSPPEPLPASELATWLPGVAAALDYIHGQQYIHRDVKPANILFDASGYAYLSDFGVAKAAAEGGQAGRSTLTGTGMVLGTPDYMAPELIMGQKCDGRVDQYALAVTVYEILCGSPPFEGPTPSAVLVKHTTQPVRPLSDVIRSIPPSLSEAVLKGLAKDPGERYPSCKAFADAVLQAATEPVKQRAHENRKTVREMVPMGSSPATLVEQFPDLSTEFGERRHKNGAESQQKRRARPQQLELMLAAGAVLLLLVGAATVGWFAWGQKPAAGRVRTDAAERVPDNAEQPAPKPVSEKPTAAVAQHEDEKFDAVTPNATTASSAQPATERRFVPENSDQTVIAAVTESISRAGPEWKLSFARDSAEGTSLAAAATGRKSVLLKVGKGIQIGSDDSPLVWNRELRTTVALPVTDARLQVRILRRPRGTEEKDIPVIERDYPITANAKSIDVNGQVPVPPSGWTEGEYRIQLFLVFPEGNAHPEVELGTFRAFSLDTLAWEEKRLDLTPEGVQKEGYVVLTGVELMPGDLYFLTATGEIWPATLSFCQDLLDDQKLKEPTKIGPGGLRVRGNRKSANYMLLHQKCNWGALLATVANSEAVARLQEHPFEKEFAAHTTAAEDVLRSASGDSSRVARIHDGLPGQLVLSLNSVTRKKAPGKKGEYKPLPPNDNKFWQPNGGTFHVRVLRGRFSKESLNSADKRQVLRQLGGTVANDMGEVPQAKEKPGNPQLLSGRWKSTGNGNTYELTDDGSKITVTVLDSDYLTSGNAVFTRQGNAFVVETWECIYKDDLQQQPRDMAAAARVLLNTDGTLDVRAEAFFFQNGKFVRRAPFHSTWKKISF